MPKPTLPLLCAALLAAGCATSQLKPDFAGFSTAYADNMNWQMLLNLARLDQGHPAYFMAIGEIRLGRNQSVGGNLTATSSHATGETVAAAVSNTVTNVLSGTLTPNAATSANPTFVFIPLNSEETAEQLLSPIAIDVFNTLHQQGWPVGQLLHVLVERIEVDIPAQSDQPAQRIVLPNSPTGGTPQSFATFLRVCEIVHDLQRSGGLNLVGEEGFSALSQAEVENISAKEVSEAADKSRACKEAPTATADNWARADRATASRPTATSSRRCWGSTRRATRITG